MNEELLKNLENVPSRAQDPYLELEEIVNEKAKSKQINQVEKARLDFELNLIKNGGIAKVFLFGLDLIFNDGLGITYGAEGNSYVNYLLGISTVNPVIYNLPFERFFNENRNFLPSYNIIVKNGKKGSLLKSLYAKYGENNIIKSKEDNDNYFISSKPIRPDLIKETKIIAKVNEESYSERISLLSYIELTELGYYNFSINEVKDIKLLPQEKFTEEEIYKKTKEISGYYVVKTEKFTGIDAVKEILVNTDYKLVYQEQVIEILNKICGYDLSKADYFRRETAKAKRTTTEELKNVLISKYGQDGEKLYEYLLKSARYTISKAYLIACLSYKIEY